MTQSFVVGCWLFTLAVALHNLEEAIFLPAWSRQTRRWGRPVGSLVAAALLMSLPLLLAIGRRLFPESR